MENFLVKIRLVFIVIIIIIICVIGERNPLLLIGLRIFSGKFFLNFLRVRVWV